MPAAGATDDQSSRCRGQRLDVDRSGLPFAPHARRPVVLCTPSTIGYVTAVKKHCHAPVTTTIRLRVESTAVRLVIKGVG